MNMAVIRLPAFVLAVITSLIFSEISSAKSLAEGIDKLFVQLTEASQPEFLDPDDSFILSA